MCFVVKSFMLQGIGMAKKQNKTLYLPEWILGLLDREKGKPGVIVGASIYDFVQRQDREKVRILKAFRSKEIEVAYGDNPGDTIVGAAEDDATKIRQKQRPRRAKSG